MHSVSESGDSILDYLYHINCKSELIYSSLTLYIFNLKEKKKLTKLLSTLIFTDNQTNIYIKVDHMTLIHAVYIFIKIKCWAF